MMTFEQTISAINAGEKFTPLTTFDSEDDKRRYRDAIEANERRLQAAVRQKLISEDVAKSDATRQKLIDAQKQQALTKWKLAGGDESAFNEAWPDIQRQLLISAASAPAPVRIVNF